MMANFSVTGILPNRVADVYIKLKSITSKLHNTSTSIAFIKKVWFVDVIPKFAIIKGQFINERDSLTAPCELMKSHLFNQACSTSLQFINTI